MVKIIAKHRNTKNALVRIWSLGSLSLRGGMSVTYNPIDVVRQLTDIAKTKREAEQKAKS